MYSANDHGRLRLGIAAPYRVELWYLSFAIFWRCKAMVVNHFGSCCMHPFMKLTLLSKLNVHRSLVKVRGGGAGGWAPTSLVSPLPQCLPSASSQLTVQNCMEKYTRTQHFNGHRSKIPQSTPSWALRSLDCASLTDPIHPSCWPL